MGLRRFSKLFFTVVPLCAALGIESMEAQPVARPKLVVVFMVDELSAEQLTVWQKKFERGGIARLMTQGTYLPNVSTVSLSGWQGVNMATFFTGATPSVHGVVSNMYTDRYSKKVSHSLYGLVNDDKVDSTSGIFTNNLLASTVADELTRLYPKTSKVRAIGMSADILGFAVGHSNEGFYRFNEKSGLVENRSVGSLPFWVSGFNDKKFGDIYKAREWGPVTNINDYYQAKFDRDNLSSSFLYRFNTDLDYSRLIYSPFGNIMMRDLTVSMIINENLGKDEYPDMLTVSFSLKPGVKKTSKQLDAETEDMALRLDSEIANMVRFFEENVGLENVLIILTGAKNPGVAPSDYQLANVPAGVFNGRKAISLLNLYFMARYGQGKWLQSYHDGAFYLNEQLIAEKNMSLDDMRRQTAEFLLQMSGIAKAYTYQELAAVYGKSQIGVVQAFHPKRSGDVVVELEPGWAEELDNGAIQSRPPQNRQVPVVFFGAGVPAKTIKRVCPLIDVAPTICTILQIAYPNGCEGVAIQELFNK
ncbi:MAG: alkaline phosphatase family protein [Breznakibacter sp.]